MTVNLVPHGTAEALAVIAHLSTLPASITPDTVGELPRVYRPLLGPVADPAGLFGLLHPQLLRLWRLLSLDYDDEDLDPVGDDPAHAGLTQRQLENVAADATYKTLVTAVESRILLARYGHAERQHTARTQVAA